MNDEGDPSKEEPIQTTRYNGNKKRALRNNSARRILTSKVNYAESSCSEEDNDVVDNDSEDNLHVD